MPESEPSWFGFLLSIKENAGFNRLELIKFLEENNVGTRLLFSGNILRQPVFVHNHFPLRINNSDVLYSDELSEEHYKTLPNTEFIMNNTFWIGVWPGIEEKDLNYIINIFHNFIQKAGKK